VNAWRKLMKNSSAKTRKDHALCLVSTAQMKNKTFGNDIPHYDSRSFIAWNVINRLEDVCMNQAYVCQ
jgi:hypothetical protein